MVRDQALALSGLLSRRGRRPVASSRRSPTASGRRRSTASGTWATSTGDDRYRRGLYTFWRRTVPYPVDGHVRRPQPRDLHGPADPHQHAAPGVRHAERPGLRRGRAGPGAADRPRGGRDRRGPRPLRPAALPVPAAASREQVEPLVALYRARARPLSRATAEAARPLATEPLGPAARRAWTPPSWPPGRPSPTCC